MRYDESGRGQVLRGEDPPSRVYLDNTNFDDPTQSYGSYEIGISDKDGVIVYSECCAERMSDDVAAKVHEALGRYLAARKEAR